MFVLGFVHVYKGAGARYPIVDCSNSGISEGKSGTLGGATSLSLSLSGLSRRSGGRRALKII